MLSNVSKKLACLMFAGVMLGSVAIGEAATEEYFGTSKYCTAKISQSLINKKGKQYATVKLKTYDMLGWMNSKAKVKITLKDGNGRYITSWVGKGGDTLKLGDDHSVYRIYVDYYDKPGNGVITQGNNFTNRGKSYKWKFSNAKNCKIY